MAENLGMKGWVLLLALVGCGEPEVQPLVAGDVLLVVVDTLRADVLSCYGYPKPTSPVLDGLAREGIRFDEVLTQAPNTATSHATLFTGLTPWTHRVANLTSLELGTSGLPDGFVTLAERFAGHGYRTAAFTDGGPLGRSWNLMQGFEHRESKFEGVEAKVDQLLAWMDDPEGGAGEERSNFVFLHTYQVHEPYLPPVEYVEQFNSNPDYAGPVKDSELRARKWRDSGRESEPNGKILYEHKANFDAADVQYLFDLYTAELAYTDAQLGRLFDALDAQGRLDDMTIIVTSDHGEEFGEHGHFGHSQLHRETLRVPLIVRFPKTSEGVWTEFTGQVVEQRVNQVDVHATLVELMGATWEVGAGRSFFGDMRAGAFSQRTSFSETTEGIYSETFGDLGLHRAVRQGEHVFLETERGGQKTRELLRAGVDALPLEPGEAPLATDHRPGSWSGEDQYKPYMKALSTRVDGHLEQAVQLRLELLEGLSSTFTLEVDEELAEELGALGYVDTEMPGTPGED
ncbi:MAG: arylsulfatase A-like enzyme [Planctomycetota bacterium]|jgi:arylsulfatase A-like enzyme